MKWKSCILLNFEIFITATILLIFLAVRPVKSEEDEKPETHHDVCVCPMDYEPVCATDSKTYSNTCDLACAQRFDSSLLALCHSACPCNPLLWTYLNLTSTETSVKARVASDGVKQICDCTKIWKPVCGSDGVTYSNQCLVDCEHSKDPNIVTLFEGECA